MSNYYQPSNRMPLGGTLSALLLGLPTAVVLAFVYVYAVWYIPLVYLNFFFTLGFGFGMGWVLKQAIRTGKLRSPRQAGWLAVAVGLWGWYVQWAVYAVLLMNAGTTEEVGSRFSYTPTSFDAQMFLSLLGQPGTLLGLLPRLAAEGTWGIFGVTVSGIFLWLIWLVEAGMLLFLPWSMAQDQAGAPFSEKANEWAEKARVPKRVPYALEPGVLKAAFESGDFTHLAPHTGGAPFARLHLYTAPNDADCCYLSLENVVIETDKNGKPSEKTTDVLQYLRVSSVLCQELHERFEQAPEPAVPAASNGPASSVAEPA